MNADKAKNVIGMIFIISLIIGLCVAIVRMLLPLKCA